MPGCRAHQDGHLDVASDDAVGDLVQRAVAADDNEQRRTAVDRVPRAPSGGPDLGEEHVPREPATGGDVREPAQRLPVEPLADAGLTRNTVGVTEAPTVRGDRLQSVPWGSPACDGPQGQLSHLVHRCAHLLIGNADELALDHDVAHRQHAAGLHLAERTEREQHGGLHLDGKDAAL